MEAPKEGRERRDCRINGHLIGLLLGDKQLFYNRDCLHIAWAWHSDRRPTSSSPDSTTPDFSMSWNIRHKGSCLNDFHDRAFLLNLLIVFCGCPRKVRRREICPFEALVSELAACYTGNSEMPASSQSEGFFLKKKIEQ